MKDTRMKIPGDGYRELCIARTSDERKIQKVYQHRAINHS